MIQWLLVVMLCALALANDAPNAVQGLTSDIKKEVSAAIDPWAKTAVSVGFSQCNTLKKWFHMDYDSYKKEPDMSELTLDFITKEIKTKYYLTKINKMPLEQVKNLFDPKRILYCYVHGFTDSPDQQGYETINDVFTHNVNGTILALDASSLIKWLYIRSSTYIRFIGQKLGENLAHLHKAGLNPALVHLIGHSLGSHIVGFAGKTFYNLTGSKIGRITSLDPAGPCFADVEPALRLNRTDAEFVDVIHSDAGVFGLNDVVGHVDYFPNSGSEQPNCMIDTCSHSRAWHLYAESVQNHTAFPAVNCTSWKDFKAGKCDNNTISYMGYPTKPGTTGQFYLQTDGWSPFGRGLSGIKYVNNAGIVRTLRDKINFW